MSSLQYLLTWLEHSTLGNVIRESGVWTYGAINLIHILGIAALFGSILVLDLRLLGWRRDSALTVIVDVTVPIAISGFCVAATSGLCLLATNATEYVGNPFLLIKFAAIALGVINVVVLSRVPAWTTRRTRDPSSHERRQLAVLGGISLFLWLIAIGAGRMIGYW